MFLAHSSASGSMIWRTRWPSVNNKLWYLLLKAFSGQNNFSSYCVWTLFGSKERNCQFWPLNCVCLKIDCVCLLICSLVVENDMILPPLNKILKARVWSLKAKKMQSDQSLLQLSPGSALLISHSRIIYDVLQIIRFFLEKSLDDY